MTYAGRALGWMLALTSAALPAALLGQAPADRRAPIDRGIGVVHFRSEFVGDRHVARDSIIARSRPDPRAEVVAVLLRLETDGGFAWSYALEGADGLAPALLEFDYEVQGLPIDRMAPEGDWARVLLGHDGAGQPRFGWVALDPARVGVVLWREHLLKREWLFFTDYSVAPPLFAEPGGRRIRGETVFIGDGTYSLYAEEVRGDWMRVRIVSPDDSCGREVAAPRTTVAWVRYIDPRGRPLVWYYTRGC